MVVLIFLVLKVDDEKNDVKVKVGIKEVLKDDLHLILDYINFDFVD